MTSAAGRNLTLRNETARDSSLMNARENSARVMPQTGSPAESDGRGSADDAGASRVAQRGPVEILAEIHQGKEGAQDAGFHFVGQVQPAGGDASQRLSMFGNVLNDFRLPRMRRVAQDG